MNSLEAAALSFCFITEQVRKDARYSADGPAELRQTSMRETGCHMILHKTSWPRNMTHTRTQTGSHLTTRESDSAKKATHARGCAAICVYSYGAIAKVQVTHSTHMHTRRVERAKWHFTLIFPGQLTSISLGTMAPILEGECEWFTVYKCVTCYAM